MNILRTACFDFIYSHLVPLAAVSLVAICCWIVVQ